MSGGTRQSRIVSNEATGDMPTTGVSFEGLATREVSIGLSLDTSNPLRLPPASPQLRVLMVTSPATPPTGVAVLMNTSTSGESELLCVTRSIDMLRAIGDAPDIESARRAARSAAVGADAVVVVLTDELVRLAEHSVELGIETLGDVGMPVLILTGLGDERAEDFGRAASWLRLHARGVLSSDATAIEVTVAVRAVSAGLVVIEPRISVALQQAALRKRPSPRINESGSARSAAESPPLSAREREVLALLAEGLATKNIAHQLGISAHTVKAHVESIFAKFGATTRAEAVAIGVRRGAVLL